MPSSATPQVLKATHEPSPKAQMNIYDWHKDRFEALTASRMGLPHALMLSGPCGIGKLDFTRALAQTLLCEAPVRLAAACGACSACGWFAAGSHPDYRQIEPATESDESEDHGKKGTAITVAQMRALPDFINITSHRGGAKIVVIHPAESLNVNAANALLKNLEEPPAHTYFLLVTHRPHQLLATLKSRCQHIPLGSPDLVGATAWLAAQGVRDPQVVLAHTGNAPLLALELGQSDYWRARAAFFHQLAARDIDIITASEAASGIPIPHVVTLLQKWSYDLVHYQVLGRVRYNPDHLETISRAAAQIDIIAASRFHREMVRLQRIVQHPLNTRLFIENVLLSYRELMHSLPAGN